MFSFNKVFKQTLLYIQTKQMYTGIWTRSDQPHSNEGRALFESIPETTLFRPAVDRPDMHEYTIAFDRTRKGALKSSIKRILALNCELTAVDTHKKVTVSSIVL